ncbi:MAG: glycosyltransferase [Clostridiaceae bacterium]|nr:glycosyltransferase [Clostridiaceae bacterium]
MNVKGLTHLVTAWICGVKVRMIHNHMAYVPKVGKMKYLTPPAKVLCKLFATHWLACSDDAAIDMFGKKAFEKGKVIVLPNAIQVEKYDFNIAKRAEQRKLWNLEDYFVVGIVGRFHDQKNYQFMIRIFKCVAEKYSKARLMIVGGGEQEKEVHSWVKEYGVEDKTVFTGIRTDVPDLLQAMDVFVLPTKYEGFGNVLVEAQAAGLHTITSLEGVPKSTKVTDLIEYISLNEDPSVWADEVLKYKDGYKRTSQKEAIKAAGFDVNEQVKTLENLYIEAAKKWENQKVICRRL